MSIIVENAEMQSHQREGALQKCVVSKNQDTFMIFFVLLCLDIGGFLCVCCIEVSCGRYLLLFVESDMFEQKPLSFTA